ncbi:phosphoglucosamine mutase [soil metagenome]
MAERKLFGTDGVRGVANRKLTPELAFSLGQSAGRWLVETGQNPVAVIARDTRASGPMLEAALSAGLASAGVEVRLLGVAPTPASSWIVRHSEATLGAVVSASHNPAPDNGIKFFGDDGRKLPDAAELRIEALIEESFENRPVGGEVGRIHDGVALLEEYRRWLVSLVPERLDGMKIAVDAANGAAWLLGSAVLRELGAEVVEIGCQPGDGTRINAEGGATKPDSIQNLTREHGCEVGVAFDGDADRAVFSDGEGRLINGDRTIGIWAAHMQGRGELDPPTVVGTVMSNGGFEAYLRELGITLDRAKVGDKYVMGRIDDTGAKIGGEQSGHLIFPGLVGPTGDGIATALQLFRALKREGRKASEFFDDYQPWPQLMVNMAVEQRDGWETILREDLQAADKELEGRGRVVVRPSGTQPVIRVMVEADDETLRDRVTDTLVKAVEAKLGGHVEGRVDLTWSLGD